MDDLATILTFIIIGCVVTYSCLRESGQHRSWLRTLAITVAAAVVSAALGAGASEGATCVWRHWQISEQVAALREQVPYMDALLSKEPGAEARVRDALAQDLQRDRRDRSPTKLRLLVGELKEQYIHPAIRSAEDEAVIDAWRAQSKVINWLADENAALCVAALDGTVRDALDLGSDFKALNDAHVATLNKAYLSGSGRPEQPVMDRSELVALIVESDGLTPQQAAALVQPVGPREACLISKAMLAAGERLPASRQAAFARSVLAF